MTEFLIRPSNIKDLSQITQIFCETAGKAIAGTVPSWHEVETSVRHRLQAPAGRSCGWVAEVDGKVVGWQWLNDLGIGGLPPDCQSSTYVHEDWQRCGVGAQLLKTAMDSAATVGFRKIKGTINANNKAAISLIEDLGWLFIGSNKFENVTWKYYVYNTSDVY